MSYPKFSNELEKRVLEHLMSLESHTEIRVQQTMLKLTPDCFYLPCNAHLYGIIRKAFDNQEGFNFVDILVKIGIENDDLHDTLNWIIENHRSHFVSNRSLEQDVIKIITLRNIRLQLNLIRQMTLETEECQDPIEAQKILTEHVTGLTQFHQAESKSGISNAEIAEDYFEGKIDASKHLATACEQLNSALGGGIMPKSLIIIAAGASVGKTGFSIFLMDAIARNQPQKECLFFSLEMEYQHIWSRHVGICAGLQFDKLVPMRLNSAITKSCEIPLKIYDTAIAKNCADIDFIVTTARLRAMYNPISVIVVDYLGLVQNRGNFERNDLKQADITSKLAQLAIELNCTVIALSQINRGAANRANDDRCPWPHDAADSSGGHRSAALWLGVDRPELYQDDPCYRNQFVVKCRKNRFGDLFELNYAFNEGTFSIVEPGYFRKPMKANKSPEKAIFSARGDDIYND